MFVAKVDQHQRRCPSRLRVGQVSHHTQRMGGVNVVALSHDETTVLTVGQEKRITYWDLREHHAVIAKVGKTTELSGVIESTMFINALRSPPTRAQTR